MLGFAGNSKIFLCKEAVDLRKGFEGLSGLVETYFQESLTTGAYFIFLNKARNRMKILYWDVDGLAIWFKRLEKGRFVKGTQHHDLIERRELLMLLEGVTPKRLHRRFRLC
jgi:transposase